MNDRQEPQGVMERPLKFNLLEENGTETAGGEARAGLAEESLTVMPKYGEALFFSLRDIEAVSAGDHRLELALSSRERLVLYHLGYAFDDFVRVLSRLRNELMLKDLLMQETLRKGGLEAACSVTAADGAAVYAGKGELRLYETALVLLPGDGGEPLRVPYSYLDRVEEQDYTLTLLTEFGEKLEFSRMGRDFEPFTETLSVIMNELSQKVQFSLKELLPDANPAVIRQAARLMREGKAARRGDLEEISPELWAGLERKLEALGIRHEYDFLSSLAQREKMCIGLKRGLLGDLTGEYIWFLIPVYGPDPAQPGNVMAMEAASHQGGGRATYFFRITGRAEYTQVTDMEHLHRLVDGFITRINRCMIEINFRREPIYLPEERLAVPRYRKYKVAVRKIEALQELRRLFIGRVFHRSPEQWEQDVTDLLKFNVTAADDGVKWARGEEHAAEAEDDSPENYG